MQQYTYQTPCFTKLHALEDRSIIKLLIKVYWHIHVGDESCKGLWSEDWANGTKRWWLNWIEFASFLHQSNPPTIPINYSSVSSFTKREKEKATYKGQYAYTWEIDAPFFFVFLTGDKTLWIWFLNLLFK